MRQQKQLISLAAAILALGAVVSLVAGLAVPASVDSPKQTTRGRVPDAVASPPAASTQKASEESRRALADLQQACAVDLGRPLYDAPPTPQTAPASPQPQQAIPVRLIGTANEPGHSMAMFLTDKGTIEFCPQGRSIDGLGGPVTVTEIEVNQVTVQYAGQSMKLAVPPKP